MVKEIIAEKEQLLVVLAGSLYGDESAELCLNISSYIERGEASIVIDLSDVEYVDGAYLGAFIFLHKLASKNGGSVIFKNPVGLVKDLLETTHLNKVFEIV